MKEIAQADLRGIFLRAPSALRYIIRHRTSLPAEIPSELDAAGLLEQRDEKRREIHYSRDGNPPYGSSGVHRQHSDQSTPYYRPKN